MSLFRAAFMAATALLCTPLSAQPTATLSLPQAFQRVLETHPELKRAQYLREAAAAELEEASLRPSLTAGIQIENVLGTGESDGFDAAETTLSLASVVERGDKRSARKTFAQSKVDALDVTEEARRLDLLAEVARRYLDLLGAQALEDISDAEIAQRERTAKAAAYRLTIGASPQSVSLAADAALARARLQRERARAARDAAARRLAILWGERDPHLERLPGDVLSLPTVPTLQALASLVDRSPELRKFANEARVREARVQLARSGESTDVQWQLGARRLEATNEWAAVAGLSIPLGNRSRAQPAIRAARADLAALELEREADEISLYATLAEAYARLTSAALDVSLARTDVLPRLAQAESSAERAYQSGALSFLEWAQVQSENADVRREQLAAAIDAHRALIEIQRLTGEPFLAASPSSAEATP